jgi:glycyl-tRNA synthetase alpha subunit
LDTFIELINTKVMVNSEKTKVIFYQKLGELFYAIAASDKVVREKEFAALKKLVENEWSSSEEHKDEFESDVIYQMEIIFDWYNYQQVDAKVRFENFCDYYKEHKRLFTPKKKQLIWKTVNAIASAFAGKNKAEVIMLTKLLLLMQDESD